MSMRSITAAALLTLCTLAAVRADPAAEAAPKPEPKPAPRVVELPPADVQGGGYVARPVTAPNAAPAVKLDAPAPRTAARPAAGSGDGDAQEGRRAAQAGERPGQGAGAPPRARPAAAPRRVALARPAAGERRAGYRSARFADGGGSTWRVDRDTHAFAATVFGCRITGFAGPRGYTLDRAC